MEKIATDIYTFSKLREMGFAYVDKTNELHLMASGEFGKHCPSHDVLEQGYKFIDRYLKK